MNDDQSMSFAQVALWLCGLEEADTSYDINIATGDRCTSWVMSHPVVNDEHGYIGKNGAVYRWNEECECYVTVPKIKHRLAAYNDKMHAMQYIDKRTRALRAAGYNHV